MRPRTPWLAAAAIWMGACAGRIPLPEAHAVQGTEELLAKMQAARPTVQRFTTELRLTYFGAEGRVRGTAVLAVSRPDKIRYEVQGPAGTVAAFATDGVRLQQLRATNNGFSEGAASPENMDLALGIAPLGLGPEGWVDLLMGVVSAPPESALSYDERDGSYVLRWIHGGRPARAHVDPRTATLRAIFLGDDRGASVLFGARSDVGLPESMTISTEGEQVQILVRDIDTAPGFSDSVFRLPAREFSD